MTGAHDPIPSCFFEDFFEEFFEDFFLWELFWGLFFNFFLIQNLPVGFEIYLESTQSGNVRPMTGNALLGKGCTHDLRGHSCSKLKSHISNKISWQYCGEKSERVTGDYSYHILKHAIVVGGTFWKKISLKKCACALCTVQVTNLTLSFVRIAKI